MRARIWRQWNKETSFTSALPLYIKSGSILLLLFLSVLVIACGSNGNTPTTLGSSAVTVTINLGNGNSSPTPSLAPYWCGAWATNTTPAFNGGGSVGVYAKFTHNVNMNPAGVGGASATATISWPDGTSNTQTVTTTNDGLAVFSVPVADKASAINKFTYVSVTFHKEGIPDCTIPSDHVAFFMLVVISPTANATSTGSPTSSPNGTPTVGPTTTCTPHVGRPGKPTPTPRPGGC